MGRATAHFFGPAPWKGVKRSNIIQFQLQCQFQRFFNQIKAIKHIKRDFHLVARVMPQGWDLGVLEFKSLIFPNMVMAYKTEGDDE